MLKKYTNVVKSLIILLFFEFGVLGVPKPMNPKLAEQFQIWPVLPPRGLLKPYRNFAELFIVSSSAHSLNLYD